MVHPIVRAVLDNQILLFLGVFTLSLPLLRGAHSTILAKLMVLCGLLSASIFIALGLLNLLHSPIYWHDEPNILGNAAAYMHGQALYLPPTAPALYSLLYGPCTFLIYVPVLYCFSHPLAPLGVFIFVANLGNLLLVFKIAHVGVSRPTAFALLTVAVAFLLGFPSFLFGLHADRWILFCFAAALLCATARFRGRLSGLAAVLGSGFFGGLAINFKLTVVPIVFLLIAVLYRRFGLRASIAAASMALITFVAPFLLPGVSLGNYLVWVNLARHDGLHGSLFLSNLLIAAFLLAPGLLLALAATPTPRWRSCGILFPMTGALAILACVLAGAKTGSGAWQLWPMLPFALLWAARMAADANVDLAPLPRTPVRGYNRPRCVLAAIAVASTVITLRYAIRDLAVVHPPGLAEAAASQRVAEAEIDLLLNRFPTRNLAMGYGTYADDYRSNLSFLLPLNGEQLFLDENGFVEAIFDGMPVPGGLIERVLGCTDLWLIPSGEVPFSTQRIGASPGHPAPFLFPDSIRLHFVQTHALLERGRAYDLWGCTANTQ